VDSETIPVLWTPQALGAAACFNRLVTWSNADVYIFLESGSLVGPGWLEALLGALFSDVRNGLAGPSTNRAWNQQCAFPWTSVSDVNIVARNATNRYGPTVESLEPLHSLADFCYAVKREVTLKVGAADEGYGLGPCWEMDYSARAARAGFRAVWARSSFVFRLPCTARRAREEELRFEVSKHRYQDAFCGLRLRGERVGNIYEPHCLGEACQHFAPPELIEVFRPLPPIATELPGSSKLAPKLLCNSTMPLVSCVMPTRDRSTFVRRSVDLFNRQDYPQRELIIIDEDGPWTDALERELREMPRVRYMRAPPGTSIGNKRNFACGVARGAIIAQWDDDDWFGPRRLDSQVRPILFGAADITGLSTPYFRDQERDQWWVCSPALHRQLFEADVHGGTLVFTRRVWQELAKYPDESLAEDAVFLRQALRRGARLQRVEGNGLFVYVRHGRNSWHFNCGSYLQPAGWRQVEPPELSEDDRRFFAEYPGDGQRMSSQPLVSCIMPTADRRNWVPFAIDYFLRQDYTPRELIIVDDGADSVADLLPPDNRIHYLRLSSRQTLGEKRNIGVERSCGDLLLHWDDDDWMADHRISRQVALLLRSEAEVAGMRCMLHHELGRGPDRTWLYQYPADARAWVLGNSLLYSRDFWRQSPFPAISEGEDAAFLSSRPLERLAAFPDRVLDLYVAMVHPANTSPKSLAGQYWTHYRGDVRAILGKDASRYVRPLPNVATEHAVAL
jgi:glycosyltransferase involved in cell wall biosynthesis